MARKFAVICIVGCLAQLTLCAPQDAYTQEVPTAEESLQARQYGAPPPSYAPQTSWSQPSPSGQSYGQSLPPPPPPPQPTQTYGQQQPEQPPPTSLPAYQPPPPPEPSPPPPPQPQQPSAYGSSLISGAGPAPVQDFYAPVPSDSPSMNQLFGPIADGGALTAGYGKHDEDQVIHGDVQVLPPVEETKEGETHFYNHVYPEIVKNNEIVSNKEINTYSVQKHRINVNNKNVHQYVKNIRVNTDYITNIKRINHPHQQVQVLTYVQNRYVPKLYVKHSRNDIINELPPQEIPTTETQQSVKVLPPIIEAPTATKLDYNGQVIQTLGGNGGGGGGGGSSTLFRSGLDSGSDSSQSSASSAAPTASSSFGTSTSGSNSVAAGQSSFGGNNQQQQQQQQQQASDSSNTAGSSVTQIQISPPDTKSITGYAGSANWPQSAQQQQPSSSSSYQSSSNTATGRAASASLQQRFIPSPQLLMFSSSSAAPTPQTSLPTVHPTYRSSLLAADAQQLKLYT